MNRIKGLSKLQLNAHTFVVRKPMHTGVVIYAFPTGIANSHTTP